MFGTDYTKSQCKSCTQFSQMSLKVRVACVDLRVLVTISPDASLYNYENVLSNIDAIPAKCERVEAVK